MTTIAQSILPHLPYLRRFARSLTGRQESGDAYVASVLEVLIADPNGFPRDMTPRSGLYHLFLRSWNSISINNHTDSPAPLPEPDTRQAMVIADRRLEAITPLARQAFLLVAMEGFTASEATRVLGVTPPQFEQLLDTAAREIAEQVVTDVLIIE
ncbi:MAG: response regulator, partial [Vicinamibacterales bacterium]